LREKRIMKGKHVLYKTLVIGVLILFVGASITPIIRGSIKQVKNNEVLKILPNYVDQALDYTCGSHQGATQIYSIMPMGQSFKPLYECHYGIELYITDMNPQCPLTPIQISLKENNINGSVVPGTNVSLNLTSGEGWRFFEFSSPVNLTINQTYVIDISTTTKRWGDKNTGGFCYTRGTHYSLGAPSNLSDLYFRTYVLSYPIANFTYSAEEPHVLFNGSSSYDPDGEIISYDWDFGDGIIGEGEITYHKYCELGTYAVKLTVTDDYGLKDNITKSVDVLFENIPPSIPDINGPNTGKPGVEYEYVFNLTDPDGDDCRIWIGWGDGNSTGWKGPYPSGETVKLKHSWNETGTYMIKTKLMDYCDESLWGTLEINIPRTRESSYHWYELLLNRFPMLERLLSFLLL
jgi:PKD repeat protein